MSPWALEHLIQFGRSQHIEGGGRIPGTHESTPGAACNDTSRIKRPMPQGFMTLAGGGGADGGASLFEKALGASIKRRVTGT